MIVVALLIGAAVLFTLGQWGARDLVEDHDGSLVDRHTLRDEYGRIPPSRHDAALMRRRQARLRKHCRRMEQLKQKISATHQGER